MKPTITSVTGDRGGVVGAPQPQTLFIKGTGLAPGLILLFRSGEGKPQLIVPPSVQVDSATDAIATVNVPVPTQGSPSLPVWTVVAFVPDVMQATHPDGSYQESDPFSFVVGKSE